MPLVVAASIMAGAWPATIVLTWREAIAFGCAATAWFMFARIIVSGTFGYLIARVIGERAAYIAMSVFVGAFGLAASMVLDPKLVWAALASLLFSELFYLISWFDSSARRS